MLKLVYSKAKMLNQEIYVPAHWLLNIRFDIPFNAGMKGTKEIYPDDSYYSKKPPSKEELMSAFSKLIDEHLEVICQEY